MSAAVPRPVRYQAHPVGDVRRRERQMAGVRYGARVVVLGLAVAVAVFALPFVGLVLGAALGLDMNGGLP